MYLPHMNAVKSLGPSRCLELSRGPGRRVGPRSTEAAAPSGSVVQPYVEVEEQRFSTRDDNLGELVERVMPYAVSVDPRFVGQVLTRFDFQNRSFQRLTDLVIALNRELLSDEGGQRQDIPRVLNHFWAGGRLSNAAYNSLSAWAQRAHAAGWTQYLLTDSEINGRFGDEDLPLQLDALRTKGAVVVDVSQLPIGRSPGYLALKKELLKTGRKNKLPYISDLARYAQLLATGGVYVDVDVGPGAVDLRLAVSIVGDIPMLGPGFRTVEQARDAGLFNPDTREGALLDMFRHDKLAVGNHFIMAPPGNRVVRAAHDIAVGNVLTAGVSNGGIDFLKAFDKLGIGVDIGVAAAIPLWLLSAEWVTDESDSTVD